MPYRDDNETPAFRILCRGLDVTRINQQTGAVTKFSLELLKKTVRLAHRGSSLRAIVFSDWRVQSFESLIRFIKQQSKPDVILYAGDDIERFQQGKQNLFVQLAKLSRYGVFAVAGNDDPPDTRKLISGRNVYRVHACAVLLGGFAIVGLDGAPAFPGEFGPGFNRGDLLYPEPLLRNQIARWSAKAFRNKKLIIISHTPPYGTLDFAVRFGARNIGSRPLKDFLETSRNSVLCVCGHVHRCGAQATPLGSTLVVNAASHDDPDAPGRVAVIQLDKNDPPSVQWHSI